MSQANISQSRTVGGVVYTSGVTGKPGDAPTQIRNVMERLRLVLKDAGASFETVVKANIYLADLSDREKYLNPIWNEYFSTSPPARTTVQAGLGGETLVEIEMIAEKKKEIG